MFKNVLTKYFSVQMIKNGNGLIWIILSQKQEWKRAIFLRSQRATNTTSELQ